MLSFGSSNKAVNALSSFSQCLQARLVPGPPGLLQGGCDEGNQVLCSAALPLEASVPQFSHL